MDRNQVISTLREHQGELRAAGIVHLSLFGSVARNQASATSDVDLMAVFDSDRRFSLLDMVGLERRLADLLQATVELTAADRMKERVRKTVNQEAVVAF